VTGTPGFRGYDYQVLVTVWLALDVMLDRKLCSQLVVEPEHSLEDVEVVVEPEAALATVHVGSAVPYQVQIKLSNAAWTEAPLADLVFGEHFRSEYSKRKALREKNEPLPARTASHHRDPPVAYLAAGDDHYVLITSSTVSCASGFKVEQIGPRPSAAKLPRIIAETLKRAHGEGDFLGLDEDRLASKLSIIENRNEKALRFDINRILAHICHLPADSREAALDALQRFVWDGMRGGRRTWHVDELRATIIKHGGRFENLPELRGFVPPAILDEMRIRLRERHVLLILGDTGVGKTQCALALCDEYCMADEPRRMERPQTSGEAAAITTARGPLVVYVEDPWGRYAADYRKFPMADLLELVDRASSDLKIVVTSREHLFEDISDRRKARLDRFKIVLRSGDLTPAQRKQLLLNKLDAAPTGVRGWLERHLDQVLAGLQRAKEYQVFAQNLVACFESGQKPNLHTLLKNSRAEAITDALADEIERRSQASRVDAFVIWTALKAGANADQAVSTAQFIAQRIPAIQDLRPHALLEWLVQRKILTKRGALIDGHPLQVEALDVARKRPGTPELGQRLPLLVEALVEAGERDFARQLWETAEPLDCTLVRRLEREFMDELRTRLATATDRDQYRIAFATLARRSPDLGPVEILVKALNPDDETLWYASWNFNRKWSLPPWSNETWDEVRNSTLAKQVADGYFRFDFADRSAGPFDYSEISTFLRRLGWDVSEACRESYKEALLHRYSDMRIIVREILKWQPQAWDELWQLAREHWDAAGSRWQEHSDRVTSDVADPAEEHRDDFEDDRLASETALVELVAFRRRQQDWSWLQHDGWPDLEEIVGQSICEEPLGQAEQILLALVDTFPPPYSRHTWQAIAASPTAALVNWLIKFLTVHEGECTRDALRALASSVDEPTFRAQMQLVLDAGGLSKAVQLISDSYKPTRFSCPEQDYDDTKILRELAPRAAELVDALKDLPSSLSSSSGALQAELVSLARSAPPRIAVDALQALAAAGQSILDLAPRVFANDVRGRDRLLPFIANEPGGRAFLLACLSDDSWQVREQAVLELSKDPETHERDAILSLCPSERSKHVRRALAQAIAANQWNEQVTWLLELLDDATNWGAPDGYQDAHMIYAVAQAAACALIDLPSLSREALDHVVAFVESGRSASADVEVHGLLLTVLLHHDIARAVPVLQGLVHRPWTASGFESPTPIAEIATELLKAHQQSE
jgi:hypothetical protein